MKYPKFKRCTVRVVLTRPHTPIPCSIGGWIRRGIVHTADGKSYCRTTGMEVGQPVYLAWRIMADCLATLQPKHNQPEEDQ